MYEEFLKQIEDFIFIEDKPEKADVIFVPGNGYPQMAEKAAELYRNGFAPKILPSVVRVSIHSLPYRNELIPPTD